MAELEIRAKWKERSYFYPGSVPQKASGVSLDIAVRQRGRIIFKKQYETRWSFQIRERSAPLKAVVKVFFSDLRQTLGLAPKIWY